MCEGTWFDLRRVQEEDQMKRRKRGREATRKRASKELRVCVAMLRHVKTNFSTMKLGDRCVPRCWF